ncbi:MAG: acyloxyacyl hydrolase [Chitinophaga sp.]|uniref:acyloxyacyl hydrolase n=1 Tax=Chitinophaga sp. TaxID=1869181 RepID=UPI0025BFEFB5|nr:acyloxyacyl hydrolase [Chitinophaga sp.]MBV8251034.1 acyloxyacyl hydrolase [Chitinophaga sp.]
MKYITVISYLLLLAISVQGQDTTDLWQKAKKDPNLGSHKYLELKLHAGEHLYTAGELGGALAHGYKSLEVRLGWQSSGRENWQRVFNCPSYGVGFYTGNIGDPSELGYPSGVYGFIYAPFYRSKKHYFVLGLSLGFTYDLAPFDSLKNPNNDAIGSKVNAYFNGDIGGVWEVSKTLDFVYGIDVTHFSNGRMYMPNLGLNMLGVNVGLRYHYNSIARIVRTQIDKDYVASRRPTCVFKPINPVTHYHQLSAYLAVGSVQLSKKDSVNASYGTVSLVLDYTYRYSNFGSLSAGVDGFYDGSLGWIYRKTYGSDTPFDRMLLGVHAGHSIHIKDIEIVTQGGTYLLRRDHYKGDWFLRIAFRYNIQKYGFVQIGLKTLDGGVADWIEWGGGGRYRFGYK